MAAHSRILATSLRDCSAWGHERAGYDSATKHSTYAYTLNNKIKSQGVGGEKKKGKQKIQ